MTAAAAALQNPELAAIECEQSRYYVTRVETDAQAQQAADQLKSVAGVSKVYVKPAVESPLAPQCAKPTAPATIPDYLAQQGYLDAAPMGVGARNFAWLRPGGRGANVRFVDIVGGWTLDHVELRGGGGLIGGQQFTSSDWTSHGTAVLGFVRAAVNGFGVTEIAPEASFSAISHHRLGSAGAIDLGASSFGPGDIMLLEMHRPGPRFGFQTRDDQQGYIAVEGWPDDFLAIRRAVIRGLIVVEAAGNGAQDLDDPLYDTADPSFPETWKNPFRGAVDSGAIVVGAGAPPGGLFGADRSRLEFSDFGSRIDCQGWGIRGPLWGHGRRVSHRRLYRHIQRDFKRLADGDRRRHLSSRRRSTARQSARPLQGARSSTGDRQSTNGWSCRRNRERIGSRPHLAALIASITPSV